MSGRAGLHRLLRALLRDTRGATAILFAIALLPMTAAVGLAIDSSLGFLLKSRMSKSLDAAGLAAGRVALNDDADDVARSYFDANFGTGSTRIAVVDFDFELDPTRQFVTLTAEATAPTYFMRVFGHNQLRVTARTVIERQTTGMELALVLDNTGSMVGTPFNTMQQAAYDLVDIIYGDETVTEIENLWISLVPYTATVNIGPARTGWLDPADRVNTGVNGFPAAEPWKGCVMARATPMDTDDTPPAGNWFRSYHYDVVPRSWRADSDDVDRDGNRTEMMWFDDDNFWPPINAALAAGNNGRGPNLGCGPAITPLTASRATIDTAIGGMGAWHRGGTAGNLGLTWGWRTISPRWRGLWGGATPATHPLDYGTPLMEKVVVILTDGNNQFYDHDGRTSTPASDFTAYGRIEAVPGVTSSNAGTKRSQGRAVLDGRMSATCTAMKAQGIRIYTITFGSGGSGPDATAQALFRSCASSPALYYHAPTNADLATAFRAIGGELANLRIVE